MSPEQVERYARHLVLKGVGGPGQKALLDAAILVVGAGGLGCPILAYLAAAGVGRITVLDHDRISLSNLQRQILFRTEDVGEMKAAAAAAWVRRLNPDVHIQALPYRFEAEQAGQLINGHDLVMDGTDNFTTRLAVSDACVAAGIPLIAAAIGQYEGQVMGFDPSQGGPCYRCFVPDAPDQADDCQTLGVMGALAGLIGSMAALEAVKWLTGQAESIMGRLILHDALTQRQRVIRIAVDPHCAACGTPERKSQSR